MRRLFPIVVAALLVAFPTGAAEAQPADEAVAEVGEERISEERRLLREEFEGIGVDERMGEYVDLDAPFFDTDGNVVSLRDYVQGDIPLVLTFVYHDCPMLCSLVLDGFTKVMSSASLELGVDYRAVAVSIDPRDTPELSAEAHDRYARRVADAGDPDGLIFLTAEQPAIDAVTEATGFRFHWVEEQQEFAHTATLVFLSPEGRITRYLYGIEHTAGLFRRSMVEAGEGTIGSPVDQLILYCFVFDPDQGGYVLHAWNAMKLGGLLTVILLGGGLFVFWRRERRTHAGRREAGDWRTHEDILRTARGA